MEIEKPILTVGVPLFNSENHVDQLLQSILSQTLRDIEIIVSDNASTDNTEKIVRSYAAKDSRIRYIRQNSNIGAVENFSFLLKEANSQFFTWAAADDVRTSDFFELNTKFLMDNSEYVASTSPNSFDEFRNKDEKKINFSITGSEIDRIHSFLDNCWDSHAVFYSVMRTDIIRKCEAVGKSFLGADWAVNLFLAKHGNINRTSEGLLVVGSKGLSNSDQKWSAFREPVIGWIIPFYRFSQYAFRISEDLTPSQRLRILWRLIALNAFAARKQFKFEAKRFIVSISRRLSGEHRARTRCL